jgi:hypothetical protein
MSIQELLTTLGGIEETVLIYPTANGRPRARRQLTKMEPIQTKLLELFGLTACAPKARAFSVLGGIDHRQRTQSAHMIEV